LFKTARFKVHNPSRHKAAVLSYALQHYHLTLKRVLEAALADPELKPKITKIGKNGKERTDKAALSRLLYTLAPKNWALAPLRDYMIQDAAAMLLSHFEKAAKGKNESNPPTLRGLDPPSQEDRDRAFAEFASTEFVPSSDQDEEIQAATAAGQVHRAQKLTNIYSARSEREAMRDLLRKFDAPIPIPVNFTRHEFERGFMLARKGDNYYVCVRLFSKKHHFWRELKLDQGFTDWKTKELIECRRYPGVILPLEFGRDYHDEEYLVHGKPQSAKLMLKRNDAGQEEFYLHISFEFTPEPVRTETYLGIDRGSARIGSASVIGPDGGILAKGLDLEGAFFHRELRRFEHRIAEEQRKGAHRPRLFRLRRRWADIAIGEYANRIIAQAVKYRSQIALESINARSMARFLNRSQFAKLHAVLTYKAERVGLPKPVEVPAPYTSQTCARCGHRDPANRPKKDEAGKPLQDVFRCTRCGHEDNADVNASVVIALRALHQSMKGGKFQKFVEFQEWLEQERAATVLEDQ
jgi:transposase